jgi:hypothetical protein
VKKALKIVSTNWINFLVIFIALYLAGFLSALLIDDFLLREAFVETLYSLLGYGMVFWISFLVLIGILDIILFSLNRRPQFVIYKLALEWVLISSPFIYWLVKYNQWIFLVAIFSFLVGQYLRRSYIFKILS